MHARTHEQIEPWLLDFLHLLKAHTHFENEQISHTRICPPKEVDRLSHDWNTDNNTHKTDRYILALSYIASFFPHVFRITAEPFVTSTLVFGFCYLVIHI